MFKAFINPKENIVFRKKDLSQDDKLVQIADRSTFFYMTLIVIHFLCVPMQSIKKKKLEEKTFF